MTAVTWGQANARRLARHGLASPFPSGTPVARAAEAMGGVHAQILTAAELSAALRVTSATRSDVRRALWEERTLVKTHGPRGTVHLLSAGDLPSYMAALGAVPWSSPFPEGVRMTAEQTESVVEAIGVALDGSELTVDELNQALGDMVGSWAVDPVMPAFQTLWPRWRQATDRAAYAGALCYGPDRGRKTTYTHPRRWAGKTAAVDPETAVAWLLERYLDAFGPATSASFARWVGAPPAWAAEQMAEHPRLVRVQFQGQPAWDAADASYDVAAAQGVRLLPYFDAFVVGSRPRHLLFPRRACERALSPSGQAGNYPVVLVDGEVAGVWHQRRQGRRVAVTVEPLGRVTRRLTAALDEQVIRLGQVLDADATLTIGEVAVGPHA